MADTQEIMVIDQERRTGRTTEQLRYAPGFAWYVVPYSSMKEYCRALCRDLKRPDISFITIDQLELTRGSQYRIVLDHAVLLTGAQYGEVLAHNLRANDLSNPAQV